MLQIKYKDDGKCQRYGTLTFRIYAAEDNLTNVYFKLKAQNFFRGCIDERCIFVSYIAAGGYSEITVPFRSKRGFNSPQVKFDIEVQCSSKNGNDVKYLCWNGALLRDFAAEKNSVHHTTYHIENKTTLNASENAIAYAGSTSNNYSELALEKKDDAEIRFVDISGHWYPTAVSCNEPVLVKIDTGKDLERAVRNEMTICFDPCFAAGVERKFTLKKVAGTLSVSGKNQMFYVDKFFSGRQESGGYQFDRFYCRIPVVLSENVPQVDLCQLTCAGEMNGQEFYLSMPQNSVCTLFAPRDPEFSDIEDYGSLPMLREERADELFRNAEQAGNSDERNNLYMRALPAASEKVRSEILSKIGQSYSSQLDFSSSAASECASVLHLMSGIDAYKEERQELKRETEFLKACRLYGTFGNGLNPAYAYEVFLKEYESGNENSVAATRLAECYMLGIGTERNLAKGVELMRHAADAGNAEAMLHYADCCFSGTGILPDIELGKKYLLAAADAGNTDAMCKLAGFYLSGKMFPKNYAGAKQLYAAAGTADARYALACMQYFGIAGEQNIPAAAECFAELSNSGHVPSEIMYANCLANGIGVEKDVEKAEAVCAGISSAAGVLGGIAFKISGMANFKKKEYKKAVELLKHAVMCHNVEAAFFLSQKCYREGCGTPRDGVLAVELLKWASRKNHKKSQLQLAECWLRGLGVYRDFGKAIEILKKFEGSSDPHYLFMMGMCRYHGMGVEEDEPAGLRMLKQSADAGYQPAIEYLEDAEL